MSRKSRCRQAWLIVPRPAGSSVSGLRPTWLLARVPAGGGGPIEALVDAGARIYCVNCRPMRG